MQQKLKMGFDPPRGLSKRQQGMLMPIEPQRRKNRERPKAPQDVCLFQFYFLEFAEGSICSTVTQKAVITHSQGDTHAGKWDLLVTDKQALGGGSWQLWNGPSSPWPYTDNCSRDGILVLIA